MPRRTVRRERCFLLKNDIAPYLLDAAVAAPGAEMLAVVVSASSALLIWNAGLLMTPRMNEDNR
jgi:hypothetical protein